MPLVVRSKKTTRQCFHDKRRGNRQVPENFKQQCRGPRLDHGIRELNEAIQGFGRSQKEPYRANSRLGTRFLAFQANIPLALLIFTNSNRLAVEYTLVAETRVVF